MSKSQRIGWICQSSALPVFLMLVKALLTRAGTSMVSRVNLQGVYTCKYTIVASFLILGQTICHYEGYGQELSDLNFFASGNLTFVRDNAWIKFLPVFIAGWGDTGIQETSTDKLQETLLTIVPSRNCIKRMNETEDVDENLIVCGGGAAEGPCKVCHQKLSLYSN